MTNDIADHPFSAENIARESGASSRDERNWLNWSTTCERLLGHDLDGNDVDMKGDGYSLDEAFTTYRAGTSPHAYVTMVGSRERYRKPS